jgi:hypothetical protein
MLFNKELDFDVETTVVVDGTVRSVAANHWSFVENQLFDVMLQHHAEVNNHWKTDTSGY